MQRECSENMLQKDLFVIQYPQELLVALSFQ